MLRTLAVIPALALALGPTALAHAQPQDGTCDYELSPPTLVTVSGTTMVTATVSPRACAGAVTFQTVACLQMAGESGPGQCSQGRGILPAQVLFQPYRPGTEYTATGKGCASAGNPPAASCRTVGPLTVTL
ncbi:hypothetical protein [Mycobacterium kyogaense]|uniref:hypothetical protein n=1 Tax=Mycobacterium kyogaense TaxID=2212479 RepID=UPI000DADB66C|nr:hypothetical protein [Mycobacterium kyogaense]